jgi:hypothetical protein
MSSSGAPEPAEYDEDADGPDLGDEAKSLLSDPVGYIRGVVLSVIVGSVISVVTFVVSTGLDVAAAVRGALAKGGGAVTDSMLSIWGIVETVIALPIGLSGDLAASAGLLGPVVAAGAFGLTAALAGLTVYLLWRAVVIIT